MKRITPEDVVDAYIATGMYPVFKKWGTLDQKGGCALTTIGTMQGCYKHPCSNGSKANHYASELGLERLYLSGFVHGFDRPKLVEMGPAENTHYDLGRYDGRAARMAVKAHFAKAKKAAARQAQQVPELELVR